jgi:hypothetical protein
MTKTDYATHMDDRLADILDDCLEQMRQGATPDECLGHYSAERAELEPLLRAAEQVVGLPVPAMPAAARAAIEQRLLSRVVAPHNLTAPSPRPPLWANPVALIILAAAVLIIVVVLVSALVAVMMHRGSIPTPVPAPQATIVQTAATTPGAMPTEVAATPMLAAPSAQPTLAAQTPTAPGLRNVLTPLPSEPLVTPTQPGGLRNEPIISPVPPTAAPPPPPPPPPGNTGGNGGNGGDDGGGDQNCQGHQNGRDDPKCDRDDDKSDNGGGKDNDDDDDDD